MAKKTASNSTPAVRKTDAQRIAETAVKTRKSVAKATSAMCASIVKVTGNPDGAAALTETWKAYDSALATIATVGDSPSATAPTT